MSQLKRQEKNIPSKNRKISRVTNSKRVCVFILKELSVSGAQKLKQGDIGNKEAEESRARLGLICLTEELRCHCVENWESLKAIKYEIKYVRVQNDEIHFI